MRRRLRQRPRQFLPGPPRQATTTTNSNNNNRTSTSAPSPAVTVRPASVLVPRRACPACPPAPLVAVRRLLRQLPGLQQWKSTTTTAAAATPPLAACPQSARWTSATCTPTRWTARTSAARLRLKAPTIPTVPRRTCSSSGRPRPPSRHTLLPARRHPQRRHQHLPLVDDL